MRFCMISALAALIAIFVMLAVWLLVHLGFDDETANLMLSYITNFPLMILVLVASALIGLIEATVITFWRRRRPNRTLSEVT